MLVKVKNNCFYCDNPTCKFIGENRPFTFCRHYHERQPKDQLTLKSFDIIEENSRKKARKTFTRVNDDLWLNNSWMDKHF